MTELDSFRVALEAYRQPLDPVLFDILEGEKAAALLAKTSGDYKARVQAAGQGYTRSNGLLAASLSQSTQAYLGKLAESATTVLQRFEALQTQQLDLDTTGVVANERIRMERELMLVQLEGEKERALAQLEIDKAISMIELEFDKRAMLLEFDYNARAKRIEIDGKMRIIRWETLYEVDTLDMLNRIELEARRLVMEQRLRDKAEAFKISFGYDFEAETIKNNAEIEAELRIADANNQASRIVAQARLEGSIVEGQARLAAMREENDAELTALQDKSRAALDTLSRELTTKIRLEEATNSAKLEALSRESEAELQAIIDKNELIYGKGEEPGLEDLLNLEKIAQQAAINKAETDNTDLKYKSILDGIESINSLESQITSELNTAEIDSEGTVYDAEYAASINENVVELSLMKALHDYQKGAALDESNARLGAIGDKNIARLEAYATEEEARLAATRDVNTAKLLNLGDMLDAKAANTESSLRTKLNLIEAKEALDTILNKGVIDIDIVANKMTTGGRAYATIKDITGREYSQAIKNQTNAQVTYINAIADAYNKMHQYQLNGDIEVYKLYMDEIIAIYNQEQTTVTNSYDYRG